MQVQIISDIHLEMGYRTFEKNEQATILVLAGDIGKPTESSYEKLLADVSDKFEHIFIISGNHEYYSSKRQKTDIDREMYQVCKKFGNVHALMTSSYQVGDYLFLGTTLWSDVKPSFALTECISDYSNINSRVAPTPPYRTRLTPEKVKEWHRHELSWLIRKVKENPDANIVVITHHTPSFKSCEDRPEFMKELNVAYSTDLESFILEHPQIRVWIHGHTHSRHDYYIGSTRVICNPMGYPGEMEYSEKVIELP